MKVCYHHHNKERTCPSVNIYVCALMSFAVKTFTTIKYS